MPALVVVPGTFCGPAVADRLAAQLAGDVDLDVCSWMTGPGPWTIEAVADAVAAHIRDVHGRPVLVLGHSTGGAIALRLAISHPDVVAGLVVMNSGRRWPGTAMWRASWRPRCGASPPAPDLDVTHPVATSHTAQPV